MGSGTKTRRPLSTQRLRLVPGTSLCSTALHYSFGPSTLTETSSGFSRGSSSPTHPSSTSVDRPQVPSNLFHRPGLSYEPRSTSSRTSTGDATRRDPQDLSSLTLTWGSCTLSSGRDVVDLQNLFLLSLRTYQGRLQPHPLRKLGVHDERRRKISVPKFL